MRFAIHQLCACVLLCLPNASVWAKKELKSLSVLSINKFYVPDYNHSSPEFRAPKNLTYEYFTRNAVDVPNSVKRDLYNLGVELRKFYGHFLGPLYTDRAVLMRTTEFPVSVVAGELINAGLWPPFGPQVWKEDLAWQPIPFEYKPEEEDTLLLGTLCPNFRLETSRVLRDHGNLSCLYAQLVSETKASTLLELPSLYLALENGAQLNQTLPEWATSIFPGKSLLNATLAAYDLLSKTKAQKRLNGGPLVKAILKDFRAHASSGRKISVYSGDDRLFAGISGILGIPLRDVPASGAALVFELHAEDGELFVKIVYYTGAKEPEPLPYPLAGCDLFCPMRNFTELVADVLPDDELDLCYSTTLDQSDTVPGWSASTNLGISNFLLVAITLALIVATPRVSQS